MEQRSRAISSLALTAALVHLSRMPALTSSRQEKFAQLCASGLNNSEAYRRLSGKERNADVRAAQLMAQPGVRERVAEIKEQNARGAQLTRDELLGFYAEVIRTPADGFPPGSRRSFRRYERREWPKIRIWTKPRRAPHWQKCAAGTSRTRLK